MGPCFHCGQWGHWKRECPLMECDLADDPSGWDETWQAMTAETHQPQPWILETHFEGHPWQTLVDTGSSIFMVRSSLLAPSLPVLRTTRIACLHGHTEACPVVRIQLYYLGQQREVEVARVKRLPYYALLGHDTHSFREVVALFPKILQLHRAC